MGASLFESHGLGKDAKAAFSAAVANAQYEYGHGGYSGTIAEKHEFVLFTLPPRCTYAKLQAVLEDAYEFGHEEYLREAIGYARNLTQKRKAEADLRKFERQKASFWKKHAALRPLIERMLPVYHDKWGPACAVEIKGAEAVRIKKYLGRAGTHDRVFRFFGYASS